MKKERLDKFLSNQTGISRSESRTSIKRGKVCVNGVAERDFSRLIDSETDIVVFGERQISYKRYIYLVLNKPAGIITASTDKTRKTVLDLVPAEYKRRGLTPVGRLDKDTTGLLIITDDGDFAHRCISPKSNIEKSYIAELDGDINSDIINDFKNGVVLADGYKCKPAKLYDMGNKTVRIVITEGKYHQIKRMFGVFSLGVNTLKRESVGGVGLPKDLAPGECVEVPKMPDLIII